MSASYESGASIEEDFMHVYITIDGNGIRLTKNLFSPRLVVDESNRLKYRIESNGFLGADVLIGGHTSISFDFYYDFSRDRETNPLFWDRAFDMACRVRDKILLSPEWPLVFTAQSLQKALEEHAKRPRRETYLLIRSIESIYNQEHERWRELRREKRRARQEIVEQLMRLIYNAPHSLNFLRRLGRTIVTKVDCNYWRVEVKIKGRTLAARGPCPVAAASGLVWVYKNELRRLAA